MRTDTFTIEPIVNLLRQNTVASLKQLSVALGSASHRTVCRKLVQAGCRSSYSHCGRYYTLDELASYDENGLWSHDGIRFSDKGSLMSTAEYLTDVSDAGYLAAELSELVGVEANNTLYKLYKAGRLARSNIDSCIVYLSVDQSRCKRQLQARHIIFANPLPKLKHHKYDNETISIARVRLFSLLDEPRQRLFAGLESLRLGRGGDRIVGDYLGISPKTVATARKQLLAGELDPKLTRHQGGGR